MPDGSPITLYNAVLYFEDGTPVRVTEMQEIDLTTTETAEEAEQNTISIARPQEVTMNFRMPKRASRRFLNRIVYGWRAKGHLRKKALRKALVMAYGKRWRRIWLTPCYMWYDAKHHAEMRRKRMIEKTSETVVKT